MRLLYIRIIYIMLNNKFIHSILNNELFSNIVLLCTTLKFEVSIKVSLKGLRKALLNLNDQLIVCLKN